MACQGFARDSRSMGCRPSAPRIAPQAKRVVRRVASVRSVTCPRLRWNSPTRLYRRQMKRRAASVPEKRREQNPSAPKACLRSLTRFSLSARPL